MKKITIHTVSLYSDSMFEMLASLDCRFVKYFGDLQVSGDCIAVVGSCPTSFTKKELRKAVKDAIDDMRDYLLSDVTDEEIKEFLKN